MGLGPSGLRTSRENREGGGSALCVVRAVSGGGADRGGWNYVSTNGCDSSRCIHASGP